MNKKVEVIDLTESSDIIDLNNKTSPEYKEVWPLRRQIYNENRKGGSAPQSLPIITTAEWLEKCNTPFLMLLDGHYIYTAMNRIEKRFDYVKLRDNLTKAKKPIHYFSTIIEGGFKLRGFLNYLSSLAGYKVQSRMLRAIANNNVETEKSLIQKPFGSVAIDIVIETFAQILDDDSLSHVLLVSRDPLMVAAVKVLQDKGMFVGLLRCKDIPIDRELLTSVDFIIELDEFLVAVDCI